METPRFSFSQIHIFGQCFSNVHIYCLFFSCSIGISGLSSILQLADAVATIAPKALPTKVCHFWSYCARHQSSGTLFKAFRVVTRKYPEAPKKSKTQKSDSKVTFGQDKFDHDKGQKSAISGCRLHWRLSTGFFPFSPGFMCNLVRRDRQDLEKVAKNPVEKIASNPVTSVAVMVFRP